MQKIPEKLKSLKSIQGFRALESIFMLANDFVKLEILRAMEAFPDPPTPEEEDFLFGVLKGKKVLLRQQSFTCLVKNPPSRRKLARELLALNNPLGLNTRILKENLEFVSASFFEEARNYLNILAKYRFFWNRQIRIEAADILKRHA